MSGPERRAARRWRLGGEWQKRYASKGVHGFMIMAPAYGLPDSALWPWEFAAGVLVGCRPCLPPFAVRVFFVIPSAQIRSKVVPPFC